VLDPKQKTKLTHLSSNEGVVASLHVHPAISGGPLLNLECIELVQDQGIREDSRYFNRKSRSTGQPSKRQVTLIEREQIEEHLDQLGIPPIPAGTVRSNIETAGISLRELLGCQVQLGQAVLLAYEARTPCEKMDQIHPGLCEQMKHGRQGVLAQVLKSGIVRVGDAIRKL
jgi:hypothetical protein